jgi:hypothetical protein
MANKRKSCPECSTTMYARDDKHEPKGTWVTFICRSGTCPGAKRGYPVAVKEFVKS